MRAKCTATNKDGSPCNAQATRGAFCPWHDPALAEERAEARRKGGRQRSNAARARKALTNDARDLVDVRARLMGALEKVETGELSPAQATAMAALSRAITAVVQVGEFEERLAALEAQTGLAGRRTS